MTKKKTAYLAPELEILDLRIEEGILNASGESSVQSLNYYDYDSDLGDL